MIFYSGKTWTKCFSISQRNKPNTHKKFDFAALVQEKANWVLSNSMLWLAYTYPAYGQEAV